MKNPKKIRLGRKGQGGKGLLTLTAVLAFVLVLAAGLVLWDGQITGYQSLNTFETENVVTGSSNDRALRFEHIPNFIVKSGESVQFNVNANRKDVEFSDDTNLFDITEEGSVEFTPSEEDIGKHNVWIIIKDASGQYYYQNVVIMVED